MSPPYSEPKGVHMLLLKRRMLMRMTSPRAAHAQIKASQQLMAIQGTEHYRQKQLGLVKTWSCPRLPALHRSHQGWTAEVLRCRRGACFGTGWVVVLLLAPLAEAHRKHYHFRHPLGSCT